MAKRAISPFPIVFAKDFVLQTHKNQDLFGKGLKKFGFDSICSEVFSQEVFLSYHQNIEIFSFEPNSCSADNRMLIHQ